MRRKGREDPSLGQRKTGMTPDDLFTVALARIESPGIRAWALSDHNRPVWLDFTEKHLAKYGADLASQARLSTMIMVEAMGL